MSERLDLDELERQGLAAAEARIKVLEEALRNVLALALVKWGNLDTDANMVFDHARAALSPAAEAERLRELADKFMWQVRDTCRRAEAAEASVKVLEAEVARKDEALRLVLEVGLADEPGAATVESVIDAALSSPARNAAQPALLCVPAIQDDGEKRHTIHYPPDTAQTAAQDKPDLMAQIERDRAAFDAMPEWKKATLRQEIERGGAEAQGKQAETVCPACEFERTTDHALEHGHTCRTGREDTGHG